MDISLMLLEQVALSNSHWSVFNLQGLPESEDLTGTVLKHYLSHFLIYYLIFLLGFKIRRECTIHWYKKREKNNILKILNLLTLTQKVRITRVLIPACKYT